MINNTNVFWSLVPDEVELSDMKTRDIHEFLQDKQQLRRKFANLQNFINLTTLQYSDLSLHAEKENKN